MPSPASQPNPNPSPDEARVIPRAANGGGRENVPATALYPARPIGQIPDAGADGSGAAAPDAAPAEPEPPHRLHVRDIRVGSTDESGEKIDKVYAARDNYAIYRADNEVRIQYADEGTLKDAQFQNVTAVSAEHYELDYLTRGLDGRKYYLGQIAVALRIAIENGDMSQKLCSASAILGRAISAASEERARIGRRIYLRYAAEFSLGIAAALLAVAVVSLHVLGMGGMADLPAAAGSGALGALFSIAIALRGRTVAPDHDKEANRCDAMLRVIVGTLSGGALILFLTAGLLADFKLGDTTLASANLADSWRAILTFGFLAGFSERLVPDLLERKTPSRQSDSEAAGVAPPG